MFSFKKNTTMKIFIALLFSHLALISTAQKDSKLIHAFNNKFTMSIPPDVDTMSAEQMQLKYHKTPDGKTYFYSDAGVSFSIVISPVADGVTEDDMVKHKNDLTGQLAAKYTLEENVVKKVNNHNIIVMSFYSDVPDGKIFNRRFFAVVNGKLIMAAFNSSIAAEIEKRKQQIEESINSVTIN
jgi:hypothetical protein